MQFNLCENTGFFLRVALIGPSGSGKTYTALKVATELGYEKIAIIDTENRSARRYARAFSRRFHSLELCRFSPRDYIEAVHQAEQAGFEVLVIDSLSHAWMGRGGVLEMVDQSARRQARGGVPSSFSGWREVTPEHNRLVDTLVQARLHIIVTMRTKTEYVVDKDDRGRAVPRKVGLQPVQRDGLEYEFDIVGDLSPEHELCISKSRCPQLADAVMSRPGTELAGTLRAWVDGAAAAEEALADETEGPAADVVERVGPPALPEVRPVVRPVGRLARAAEPQEAAALRPEPEEGAEGEEPQRALPGLGAGGPAGAPGAPSELMAIAPWLRRIQEAEELGSEEHLERVRSEMNLTLSRRTRVQGEALRRAIEAAKAAIRAKAVEDPARSAGGSHSS